MNKVNSKSYDMFKSNRTSQTLVILSDSVLHFIRPCSSLKVQKNSNEIDLAAVMINEHGGEIAPFKTHEKGINRRQGVRI